MDIQLEKGTASEGLIKINLKEADYQPKYEEKIKSYSKQATIKGFRPGKVPPGLIKKMYGKSILVEEINKLLIDTLNDYIKKNDIKIIGDPLPNNDKANSIDWDNQKEFDFEYSVGLVDDFTYDLNLKVTRFEIKTDKKELEQRISDMQKQYGNMMSPDTSEEGDSLYGKLEQASTGFSQDVMIIISQISKKNRKKFVGLKKEDEVSTELQGLFENSKDLEDALQKTEEEVKALKGAFVFKVNHISRVEPAELNQEFFDKIFGKDKVKTKEEFEKKYAGIMEKTAGRESDYLLARDIQKKLIESTKVSLPEDFYKRWLLTANTGLSEEALDKDFEHYVRDLKWNLIKNKIADDNGIKVENAEVVEKAKSYFREQYGIHETDEEMDKNLESIANNYLQQNNGEQFMNIYGQVRTEKIVELAKQKAVITTKKVSRDEFNKKIEN